jgi:hypothetical protein
MSHLDPEDRRDKVCRLRFTSQAKRQLELEASMAGMQLATYLWDLAQAGRALRAAEAVREINGASARAQHKSA